jgi:GntR family transcriptional regulator
MTEPVPLHIEIDFRSGISITDQIVELIYDRIVLGELRTGEQLPTVRDLAQQLKVNFNTVARAYRILDQAGVINTQHGRGTYILPDVPLQETEKSKELDRLTRDFLDQMERQGFNNAEIQAVFRRNLRERQKMVETND